MVDSTNFFSSVSGSKTSLFGLSSGINSQEIINALVLARRAPAVQLENNIAQNNAKLTAFAELKERIAALTTSLTTLRGEQGFFRDSVFEQKLAFTTSAAASGAPVGYTPPSADEVLGVSVSDKAQSGQYKVQVEQLAQNHQVRSDAVTSRTTALADLGFTVGTFDINGVTITIDADDNLLDLRDKINVAGGGVQATILSASSTEHFLVISGKETGSVNAIDFNGGSAFADSIGFTDGVGGVKNELQAAQDAIIQVNGLGVNIVRSSNTIDDVIDGVTLNLFRAEPDAEITINVENDLNAVKTNIVDFVTAFNDLKDFIDDQRLEKVRVEGGPKEFGALAFDSTLRSLTSQLNGLIGTPVAGQPDGFETLGQVGIELNDKFRLEVKDETFDNKLLNNLEGLRTLFEFNATTSDSRLRVGNVTSTAPSNLDVNGDPIPYTINIGGTDASGNLLSANISADGSGAGGAYNGTANVNGGVITATNSALAGMSFTFTGDPSLGPIDGIEVTFTRGIGDQLFYLLENASSVNGTGSIVQNEQSLTAQNEDYARRITDIDARIELYRERLVLQFSRMEAAVQQANSLKQSLQSMFDAGNKRE